MRVIQKDGQWLYECDGCGAISETVFLNQRELLCLSCQQERMPVDLVARARLACGIAAELRRQSDEQRRTR